MLFMQTRDLDHVGGASIELVWSSLRVQLSLV